MRGTFSTVRVLVFAIAFVTATIWAILLLMGGASFAGALVGLFLAWPILALAILFLPIRPAPPREAKGNSKSDPLDF